MKNGAVVEEESAQQILAASKKEYTKRLLAVDFSWVYRAAA